MEYRVRSQHALNASLDTLFELERLRYRWKQATNDAARQNIEAEAKKVEAWAQRIKDTLNENIAAKQAA